MKKAIMLSDTDKELLKDILDYYIDSEVEKEDFLKAYNLDEDSVFDEDGRLALSEVPYKAKNHIFYKIAYLWEQMGGVYYG